MCSYRKEDLMITPELLRVSEAAAILKVSGQSVRNYLNSGKIDGIKVGRNWRVINKPNWWRDVNGNGHQKGA